jgi:hypothetical protein
MVVPVHAPLSWPCACSDLKGRCWPEYGGGARDPRVLDVGGRLQVELGWETSPKGCDARVRGAIENDHARASEAMLVWCCSGWTGAWGGGALVGGKRGEWIGTNVRVWNIGYAVCYLGLIVERRMQVQDEG